MSKTKINKETAIKAVTKMLEDKEIVRSFLKGKISIDTLNQKGIKLGRPL